MSGARETEVTIEARVVVTPLQIAAAFAELTDDDQAQVLIEVARIASSWEPGNLDQWYAVGRHLRTCACSTPEARDLVRRVAEGVGDEEELRFVTDAKTVAEFAAPYLSLSDPNADGQPCPECGVPFGEPSDELAPPCHFCSAVSQ